MTNKIITILLFSLISFTYAQDNEILTASLSDTNEIVVSIMHSFHLNYGCAYPLTYKIKLKSSTHGLITLRRFSANDRWLSVQEKTSNDFFNGIDAVRFDYDSSIAYVSTPFSSQGDSVFIRITDSLGNNVPLQFSEICKYYDNRSAVVTGSCDDWVVQDDRFSTLLNLFRSYNLYLTVGIITDANNSSPSTWTIFQQQLDAGFIEAASHSRSHPDTPYVDYSGEIIGSYDDILSHLTLPGLFSLGTQKQYVYTWIAPYGSFNNTIDSLLQFRSYIVSRLYSIGNTSLPSVFFSEWDANYHHFGNINAVVELGAPSWGGGDTSLSSLNSKFDSVLAQNGIYQFMWHPQVLYPDRSLPYLLNHLTYISNRKNIWYANLGHVYLYHAMQDKLTAPIFTVVKDDIKSPNGFSLSQNYPNPFNPSTIIKYNISKAGFVTLKIYDVLGREISSIVNEYKNAGIYTVNFTGSKLTSGVYIYQLRINDFVLSKKMMFLK
jgi:peptidoglycan/xylan/chitin deacetylase (PgdA/CDA1 family)